MFKESSGHATVHRQKDALIQGVAEQFEVEIIRGGILERINYNLLGDELEDNLCFGVSLQSSFNGGEELAKNGGCHRHGATRRYEVEYNAGLKGW